MIVLTLNRCLDFTPKNEMNVERRRYFSLVELVNQKFSATLPYFNIEQKRKRKPDLKKQHYYVFET